MDIRQSIYGKRKVKVMNKFFQYLVLILLGILSWGYLFYWDSHNPQPVREVKPMTDAEIKALFYDSGVPRY